MAKSNLAGMKTNLRRGMVSKSTSNSLNRTRMQSAGFTVQKVGCNAITPTIDNILTTLPGRISIALFMAGIAIKESVEDSYMAAKTSSPTNSKVTEIIKGGTQRLKDKGGLQEAMKGSNVRLSGASGLKAEVMIEWKLPTAEGTGLSPQNRRNNGFVYLWAHEYGTKYMSVKAILYDKLNKDGTSSQQAGLERKFWSLIPRPFFHAGIMTGMAQAGSLLVGSIAPYLQQLQAANSVNWDVAYPHTNITPSLLPNLGVGLLFYFMPPMAAMQYVGLVSDLKGTIEGSFSDTMVLAYSRQMAWGQIGMTKKSARRKFRRKLWGGAQI